MDYDNQWRDPLLLTDVSTQQQQQQQQPRNSNSSLNCVSSVSKNSQSPAMSDAVGGSLNRPRGKSISVVRFTDPVESDICNGQSMLGFSPTSPDLVVYSDSPLIPKPSYEDSPECLKSEIREETITSIVLSLEEGIDGFETIASREATNTSTISKNWNSLNEDVPSEVSFELVPTPIELVECEEQVPVISVNAGGEDIEVDAAVFLQDNSFLGGDVLRTNANIGNGGSMSLYQTARFGNFTYKFGSLEPGKYIVDLHFAEIVNTEGPPGMRVFDVYIQEEKAISSLDIYARVGANKPLVVSGLEASVKQNGVSIRFQGLIGNPIVSGISVRKDHLRRSEEIELTKLMGMLKLTDGDTTEVNHGCVEDKDLKIMQSQYMIEQKELAEARRVIEDLKRENQAKSKECQEALKSLQELQNELMRKSMHVGSLAFAIEGQVKEKSKWFSALRDLQRRLKILKVEYINLSDEARKYKKCIADMDEMKCSIESAIREQVNLNKQLELKFLEGEKERKELYNKVLELKGNIRVFCRCRPLNVDEIARGASMVIDFESAKDGELTVRSNGLPKRTFKFDSVLGPQADQANVFEDTAAFASSVLDGYNVCIFAYGQTGTGKTFTMEGTKKARGVNYRTLEKLFHIIGERQKLFRYEISVSVLEVYNEQIRDLLSPGSQPAMSSKRLEVRQLSEGVHHIPGLIEAHINNLSEVWDVLQIGTNARAVSSTNANEHSSRSHCIHCVMVKGENLLSGECTKSKLWLVDLAGSERIAKTEAQGDQLREAKNINRSLSALGDVISALATKSSHVPFRNSKLTHLLQDSLGGDSKTLMFVHISPNENDLSETLCTLNFASRVKGIELGPAKKQYDSTEFLKYKQMVEKTKQDARSKDMQMKRMEETIYNLEGKVKERDVKNKNLQDKVKELESQLLIERKLARQHVDTKLAEQYNSVARPPLMDKPLGSLENINDSSSNSSSSYKPPLSFPPAADSFLHNIDSMEKENNPEIAEKLLLPKRTIGRSSLCPTARRISIASAPRRNSLIPLPSSMVQTVAVNPLPASQESIEECSPERDENESKCLLEAVTRLSEGDEVDVRWRVREFESEAEAIGRVHHPNIVRLRAYYYATHERLLVSDLIPNGSLCTALHGAHSNDTPPLSWVSRLKISQGAARGLMHIHDCGPRKYVHGNIKSSKILLDEELRPYISGFGLHRLQSAGSTLPKTSVNHIGRHHSSNLTLPFKGSEIASSYSAYLAPEARAGNKVTQKCDVYSFGIVLMEILTGRLPDGSPEGLVGLVRKVFRDERPLSEIIDPALVHQVHVKKQVLTVFHVALSCTEMEPDLRPRMRAVCASLEAIKFQ